MSNLIGILGDSWGCGEWDIVKPKKRRVTHNGIQKYFVKEKKYSVKNLSVPNTGLMHCIDMFQKNINFLKKCKIILIFVTDTSRDISSDVFWQKHYTVNDFKDRHTKALQDFAKAIDKFNIANIKLIGGLSTLNHNIIRNSNNIEFAFNVFDLLIPHIQGYEMNFEDHLKNIPKDLDRSVIDYVYTQQKIWESLQREDIMIPDGYHPNRYGHKIIFKQLVEKYAL